MTGDRHTCAYTSDGKLFITFRDKLKGSPTPGDWVAWVGTYDDMVQGGEGLYRVRLMDNTKGADCAYPPVEVLPDGTIVDDDLRALDGRRNAVHCERADFAGDAIQLLRAIRQSRRTMQPHESTKEASRRQIASLRLEAANPIRLCKTILRSLSGRFGN